MARRIDRGMAMVMYWLLLKSLLRPREGGKDGLGRLVGHVEGVVAGGLLHAGQDHVGGVKADPVEHDAGDDLVHVAVGLQKTHDGAVHRAHGDGEEKAGQPAPAPAQGGDEAGAASHHVLARGADVEQADLIGERHAQRAHQQGGGLHEGVSEVLHPEVGPGGVQKVLDDGQDGLARAVGVDEKKHDPADEQAQNDAQQGRDQRLDGVVSQGISFHALTSSLLAPAM